jgi:exopolysaccharide biosynthesis polyprenyl glycosylphosphotransferase
MLTHHRRARTRLLQALDAGLFGVALLACYGLRSAYLLWDRPPLEPFAHYLVLALVVMVLGPVILATQGFYHPPRPARWLAAVGSLTRGCIFTVLGVILVLFLLRIQLARSVVIMTGVLGSLLIYARAALTLRLDARRPAQDPLFRRVIWVGLPEETARYRARLAADEQEFLRAVAEHDPSRAPAAEFAALLHRHSANVVILCLAGLAPAAAQTILAACEREGVETLVHAGIFHTRVFRPELDRFGGEPVVYYRPQPAAGWQLTTKRLFDYAAAAVLLALLLPVFAVLAVVIKLTSAGPALFRQRRCGLNGQPFDMIKFRSMVRDAAQHQVDLEPRNEMTGPVFKVSDDPRVTPIGRFLRRHALDELPQLWNVLRGEMSLVGPRPLPVEEVHRFQDDAHRRRLSVLPGLTCLWQVRGRNDIDDFDDWVRLDLEYIDNWSLWLDCKILLATLPVVLLGRGGR